MKYGKLFVILTLMLLIFATLLSCASNSDFASGFSGGLAPSESGMNIAASPGPDTGGDDNSDGSYSILPSGQMTAAAWNDNENYAEWCKFFDQGEETGGKFFNYHGESSWNFNSLNRVKVTVKNNDTPVAGAKVLAKAADGRALFKAVTDASGTAYIFTPEKEGSISVVSGNSQAYGVFSNDSRDITISVDENVEKKNIIEIMFVIDVTGSMGDELRYVEAELADVITQVAAKNTDAVINMALLFYRDYGDSEEFAYHDFIDVTDADGLSAVVSVLKKQHASGGGDYPEAVDDALAMAVDKQWSTAATTKLIFHVLDAPPHYKETNKSTFKAAVDIAAEKGIRICPILCSGAEYLTEYLSRQAAIYTGGTFIFVTNDSGIGASHHDPNLPNVTVELLNSMLVRLISGYHMGIFSEPIPWRNEIVQK